MLSLYELLKASKGLPVSDSYAALWGKSAAESGIKTLTGRLPLFFRTSESKLRDWVLFGNNLPGKNLYHLPTDKTISGVTFIGNSTDGTVTANGTNTGASSGSLFYERANYPDGDYYLSGCADGGSVTTYNIHVYDITASQRAVGWDETTISERCYSSSQQIPVHLYSSHNYRITIQVASGYTVNNVVFKPMLRRANTSEAFEPYQVGVGEKTENGYVLNIGVGFAPITSLPETILITRKTINLGESPLTEGQTLSMSEFGDIETNLPHVDLFIAAFKGFNYDDQLSYNQPEMKIKYKESEYE